MFEYVFPRGLYFTLGIVILLFTFYRWLKKQD